ncbi:carboxylesterase family protein [Chelatococcus sambhunathii]|uniref:Carboxylesterase family protein n=1 Tax=Chelatococcus sambhunathii TaxID=363953 RepID=A0ABU1DHA0_9HYPH|nr:carboxylesterase family protein [Chelatococcus sambhunathii]
MTSPTRVGKRRRFPSLPAILALSIGAVCAPALARGADAPTVTTDKGAVRGFVKDGVARFYGIPYAAPPVGELRWRPTAEHEPWKKVRDASKFGPICLQVTTLGPFAGPANANEDCLFLNVYAPADAKRSAKLPVMVWIHGGANLDGNGNDYDGSKLARDGKVIVVTLNYRLGLLGFLAHPALDA